MSIVNLLELSLVIQEKFNKLRETRAWFTRASLVPIL